MSNTNQSKEEGSFSGGADEVRALIDALDTKLRRLAGGVISGRPVSLCGWYEDDIRPTLERARAALSSQSEADKYREAYLNMRQWAEENGLDTTAYFGGSSQSEAR